MKRLSTGELVYGHETYWAMRLSHEQSSWVGVVLVARMATDASVSAVAAKHMSVLDAQEEKAKLLVLDAGHGQDVLKSYRACKQTDIVVRLKPHQGFYHRAPPYSGRGRPLHGERFKLSEAHEADEPQFIVFINTFASALGAIYTMLSTGILMALF